jgi:hypothetical protein
MISVGPHVDQDVALARIVDRDHETGVQLEEPLDRRGAAELHEAVHSKTSLADCPRHGGGAPCVFAGLRVEAARAEVQVDPLAAIGARRILALISFGLKNRERKVTEGNLGPVNDRVQVSLRGKRYPCPVP